MSIARDKALQLYPGFARGSRAAGSRTRPGRGDNPCRPFSAGLQT